MTTKVEHMQRKIRLALAEFPVSTEFTRAAVKFTTMVGPGQRDLTDWMTLPEGIAFAKGYLYGWGAQRDDALDKKGDAEDRERDS